MFPGPAGNSSAESTPQLHGATTADPAEPKEFNTHHKRHPTRAKQGNTHNSHQSGSTLKYRPHVSTNLECRESTVLPSLEPCRQSSTKRPHHETLQPEILSPFKS